MWDKKIRIADMVVALSGAFGQEGAFPPPYEFFATPREPDHEIKISSGRFPPALPGRLVFSSGATWRLNAMEDRLCLEFFSGDFGLIPYKRCVFKPDLTGAEIHLNPDARSLHLIDFPFEYPLDEIWTMLLLSRHDGFLTHACGIADGASQGYAFCGHSGAGKSTMAKIWKKARRGTLLNDDRVIFRRMGTEFFIFGTPWCGEIRTCCPDGVPLKKVFFLTKSSRHQVRQLSADEAVARSLATSFLPFWDKEAMGRILDTACDLGRCVDFFELEFLPEAGVLDAIGSVSH